MLIYIWRDNQQEGPFAEHELRSKLQSGGLHRNVLAWAQGCEGWIPLSEVLHLDGRLENPEVAKVTSAKVLPAAQERISRTKQSGNKLLAKLGVAASLLKVYSFRRKRQWVDLRMAEFRVGEKAYSSGILLSGQEDLATQLIDVQLSLARSKEVAPDSGRKPLVTVKRCFGSFGRAMWRVVLVLKKHRLLRALGAALRKADCATKSWAMEAIEANGIENEIRILEEKMKEMERNTYPWARKPVWLATFIMVLLVGCIVLAMVSGPGSRAFSQGAPVLDTGSPAFKAFETQVKAYWEAKPDIFVTQSTDQLKVFQQLVASEIDREQIIIYPHFAQLTEPEQTKIRKEITTQIFTFLVTSGDLPDYWSVTVAKLLNITAPIASPPERSGPEFAAFVASFKSFWAAHADPSAFTQHDNQALSKMYGAELDRELKITHPNYKSLPAAEQTKLLDNTKYPLILLLMVNGGIPSNYEAYSKKFASPSPSPPQEDSPADGPSAALYLTVNGVKEAVCTRDGHLTPKYKTREGALPLVREVFHVLAPAANCYTNHATQLGDITGADDAFRGFHEATSDNGQRKWIYAEFEASIDFRKPGWHGLWQSSE